MEAGAVHAHGPQAASMKRFGFLLFLVTEGGIFLTVFATRFLLAGLDRPAELSPWLGGALTAVALASVVPALGVLRAASRGDERRTVGLLAVTMGLAALLLAGLVAEWASLSIGSTSRFGSPFYTALGLHGAHTVAALLVFAGLLRSARRGRFTPQSHFALEAGVLFWLFLVAIWTSIFAVFYAL